MTHFQVHERQRHNDAPEPASRQTSALAVTTQTDELPLESLLSSSASCIPVDLVRVVIWVGILGPA